MNPREYYRWSDLGHSCDNHDNHLRLRKQLAQLKPTLK